MMGNKNQIRNKNFINPGLLETGSIFIVSHNLCSQLPHTSQGDSVGSDHTCRKLLTLICMYVAGNRPLLV